MLIGLNGKLKSGKDEAFKIIKELRPHAEKISFTKKIKESASAALGVSIEELEFMKNSEDIVYRAFSYEDGEIINHGKPFNVREYLQRVGTEAGRNVFGENFWVDQTLPSNFKHDGDLFIVTDMRFLNEIERVIELGGYTVRVNRTNFSPYSSHESEQDVNDSLIDWELDNTGTVEELKKNIKFMLREFEELEKFDANSN